MPPRPSSVAGGTGGTAADPRVTAPARSIEPTVARWLASAMRTCGRARRHRRWRTMSSPITSPATMSAARITYCTNPSHGGRNAGIVVATWGRAQAGEVASGRADRCLHRVPRDLRGPAADACWARRSPVVRSRCGSTTCATWATDPTARVDDEPFGGGPGHGAEAGAGVRGGRSRSTPIGGACCSCRPQAGGSTRPSSGSSRPSRTSRSSAAATRASTSASSRACPPRRCRSVTTCSPGGELPALVVIEAVTRLVPGVIGREESHEQRLLLASRGCSTTRITRGRRSSAACAVPRGPALRQPRRDRALAARGGRGEDAHATVLTCPTDTARRVRAARPLVHSVDRCHEHDRPHREALPAHGHPAISAPATPSRCTSGWWREPRAGPGVPGRRDPPLRAAGSARPSRSARSPSASAWSERSRCTRRRSRKLEIVSRGPGAPREALLPARPPREEGPHQGAPHRRGEARGARGRGGRARSIEDDDDRGGRRGREIESGTTDIAEIRRQTRSTPRLADRRSAPRTWPRSRHEAVEPWPSGPHPCRPKSPTARNPSRPAAGLAWSSRS